MLVAGDPRHGVFPNLVMTPLFAATYFVSKTPQNDLGSLFAQADLVVGDCAHRRFNLFKPRATDRKANKHDQFEIHDEAVAKIESFDPARHLWLVFGHQTNFGLLKCLVEGPSQNPISREDLNKYSMVFSRKVLDCAPRIVFDPKLKCSRIGVLHRLCVEAHRANGEARVFLKTVIDKLKPTSVRTAESIVDFLSATVPLLHNEAYQDGPNPTGNSQAHFVRAAVGDSETPDLYWKIMGKAIAQRAFEDYPRVARE